MMKKIIFAIITTMILVPAVLAVSDKAKEPLDKVTFIHYADETLKLTGKAAKSPTCYKLMNVKWNSLPVSYTINPTNPQGLSKEFVTSSISTSAETWDAATSRELFNNVYRVDYTAQYGVQDYKNAIAFGDYSNSGVIAITTVWYTRWSRQIVEFDMLFSTKFSWGNADLDSTKMDLQNIATHELGHAVGLDDIYTTSCTAVTMYGYSHYGETQKRDLEQPDITGLQKLY